MPPYELPRENDLAVIFAAAAEAGIAWLLFDSEGAIVAGLPIYEREHEDL